jgi:hypothetical protein
MRGAGRPKEHVNVLQHKAIGPKIEWVFGAGRIDGVDETLAGAVPAEKRLPLVTMNVSAWAWPGKL